MCLPFFCLPFLIARHSWGSITKIIHQSFFSHCWKYNYWQMWWSQWSWGEAFSLQVFLKLSFYHETFSYKSSNANTFVLSFFVHWPYLLGTNLGSAFPFNANGQIYVLTHPTRTTEVGPTMMKSTGVQVFLYLQWVLEHGLYWHTGLASSKNLLSTVLPVFIIYLLIIWNVTFLIYSYSVSFVSQNQP